MLTEEEQALEPLIRFMQDETAAWALLKTKIKAPKYLVAKIDARWRRSLEIYEKLSQDPALLDTLEEN